MRTPVVVDAAVLPEHRIRSEQPLFWGMLGLIAIEATVFASLVVSWFYLGMGEPWPPPGTKKPDLLLPTLGTLILLASTIPVHLSDKAVSEDNHGPLRIGFPVSVALALLFLGMKVYEYSHVEYRWDTHAYGSIVWAIVILHGSHVAAVALKTMVMTVLAWGGGYFGREERIGVTVNGIYWYFVAGIWLPLYFVLYWMPRLLA